MKVGANNIMIGQNTVSEERTEPLVGFRGIDFNSQGQLVSNRNTKFVWEKDKPIEAVCDAGDITWLSRLLSLQWFGHKVPHKSCHCGLYGYFDMDSRKNNHLGVLTVIVQAWGRTEVHKSGFRSQFMKVVGIVDTGLKPEGVVAEIARRNGIPLVKPEQAKEFAEEFGHLLTKEEITKYEDEYKDAFIRQASVSAVAALCWFLFWLGTLIVSWLWDPTNSTVMIGFFVFSLLVYLLAPGNFLKHARVVIQYRREKVKWKP